MGSPISAQAKAISSSPKSPFFYLAETEKMSGG